MRKTYPLKYIFVLERNKDRSEVNLQRVPVLEVTHVHQEWLAVVLSEIQSAFVQDWTISHPRATHGSILHGSKANLYCQSNLFRSKVQSTVEL